MLSELLKTNRPILQKTNSYMLPQIDQLIRMVTFLEQTAGPEFTDAFKRAELRKGTYLVQAGSVCRHLWYLEKGIARVFVCRQGMERNQYFFFPAEIIDSFCNADFQAPSRACIQLLEDSVVYSLPQSRLEELRHAYPIISAIEKVLRACHTHWVEERLCNLQFLRAPEYYRRMLATQPYVIRHISLAHLASFLNITRETLSRIRAEKVEAVAFGVRSLVDG